MIKKTFIFFAGIFAGVSTGAYFDGFFQEENVVTDTYRQVVARFETPGKAKGDGEGSTTAAEKMKTANASMADPDVMATKADAHLASDSTKTDVADQQSKAAGSNSTSDDSANDAMASANSKSKETIDSSQAMTKSKAQEKKDKKRQKAKSLAALNVKFSKEVFVSPSSGKLKYRKLSPTNAGGRRSLPLVVFLHGSGERGDDNVSQLKHGLDYLASPEGMQKFPATIIAPQCPKDMRWSNLLPEGAEEGKLSPQPTEPMRLILELINELQITDNIDNDRVYVTGLSMGGFGTFDIIARHPAVFAAAVPLCGAGDTDPNVINRIKKTPMWIIHGQEDTAVEVRHSRSMAKALREAGGSPRYSELAGFGHNIWDAAYSDKELYKWLFNQSRTGVINPSGSNVTSVAATAVPATKSGSGTSNTAGSKANMARQSQAPSKSLQEAMQSEWRVLAATRRGRRADPATLEKMLVKFEEDSMMIAIGDRKEAAKFKLPTAENSQYPWIDMISLRPDVKDSAGILAMQGDKLVICWGLPGESRPTTFNIRAGVKTLVLQKK